MKHYVDYMKGHSPWQLCALDEIEKHRAETDFHITWQRYCNDSQCEHGECFGNWPFDFDHAEDISIAQSQCLRVYDILVKMGVNSKNILLYFSGCKGFHLELDYRAYMNEPAFDLHLIYRELYKKLEKSIKPEKHKSTMDGSIYSIRHMWRYPNTRHSQSGLYCIPLTYEELKLPYEKIFELAKKPRTINRDSYVDDPILRNTYLDARTRYWEKVQDFEKRESLIKIYTGEYPPCIKKIFEEGLSPGTRNNTMYLLARFLKKIKKEEEVHALLLDLAQKSYGNTSEANVRSIVRSAFKREGSFLSCASLTEWCEKEQCNIFSKKGILDHVGRVEKVLPMSINTKTCKNR